MIDIEKLERVQRQAARFITGDYHSREEGSVTKMLETLELETLERRRSSCRLVFGRGVGTSHQSR